MWGAAFLFHQSHGRYWFRSPLELLLSLSALVLVVRADTAAMLFCAATHAAATFCLLPHVSNHYVFAALVGATCIIGAAVIYWRQRRLAADEELAMLAIPVVRLQLLALWYWAVFHKLNADFFSDHGCGVVFLSGMVALPLSARAQGILCLLIEGMVPLLLSLRSTRALGVLAGLGLHFLLGVAYFFDFAPFLFACYFLFLPRSWAEEFARLLHTPAALRTLSASRRLGPPLVTGALCLALVLHDNQWVPSYERGIGQATQLGFRIMRFAWAAYAGGILIACCCIGWRKRAHFLDGPALNVRWRSPTLVALVPPILIGIPPYLGLGTENAFSMFSNLRTEDSFNHLLMPRAVQIFGIQRDLVTVSEGCESTQNEQEDCRRYRIPRYELLARVKEDGRAGRSTVYAYEDAAGTHRLGSHPDQPSHLGLSRKFLLFRDVPIDDDSATCSH